MLAFNPASIPALESSSTKHFSGSIFNSLAVVKNTAGSGFPAFSFYAE